MYLLECNSVSASLGSQNRGAVQFLLLPSCPLGSPVGETGVKMPKTSNGVKISIVEWVYRQKYGNLQANSGFYPVSSAHRTHLAEQNFPAPPSTPYSLLCPLKFCPWREQQTLWNSIGVSRKWGIG